MTEKADEISVSVKNIMNEAYSRDISVKTRTALDIKRRTGDFVGAFTIYGYLKTGDKAEFDVQLSYELNVSEVISSQAKSEREEHEKALRQKKIADELNAADTLTKSLVDLLIKRVYVFPDNRIELEYNPQTFF